MGDLTAPALESFYRLAGESEEEWLAFKSYRDQQAPRAVRRCHVNGAGVRHSVLFEWANRWRWLERAAAYDTHLDRIVIAEREALLREDTTHATARQLATVNLLFSLASSELEKLLQTSETSNMPGTISPRDAIRAVEIGVKMTRLIKGETTANVAISTPQNIQALTLDDLELLEEMQRKVLQSK